MHSLSRFKWFGFTKLFPSLFSHLLGYVGCLLLVIVGTCDWHGRGLWEIWFLRFCSGWCGIHTWSGICLLCWPCDAPAGKCLMWFSHIQFILLKFVRMLILVVCEHVAIACLCKLGCCVKGRYRIWMIFLPIFNGYNGKIFNVQNYFPYIRDPGIQTPNYYLKW